MKEEYYSEADSHRNGIALADKAGIRHVTAKRKIRRQHLLGFCITAAVLTAAVVMYKTEAQTIRNLVNAGIAEAKKVVDALSGENAEKRAELAEAISISSAEELDRIRDRDLGGSYVLTADIDLSELEWEPIGTEESPFTGKLFGNGYTISGLSVNLSADSDCNGGMFGCISGGMVDNLTVNGNVKVTCSSDSDEVFANAGMICGYIVNGTVQNCSVEGSVTAAGEESEAFARAAGIAAAAVNSQISDCEVNASVIAEADAKNTMAAGIAAWLDNSAIERCIVSGSVQSRDAQSVAYAGGISASGSENGKVNACAVMLRQVYASGAETFTDYVANYADLADNIVSSSKDEDDIPSGEILLEPYEMDRKSTYKKIGWDMSKTWKLSFLSARPSLRHRKIRY